MEFWNDGILEWWGEKQEKHEFIPLDIYYLMGKHEETIIQYI